MATPTPVLDVGQFTHVGQVRKRNEDSLKVHTKNHVAGQLFIVADGVGGESRGDEASQYAIERIGELYYKYAEDHPNIATEDILKRVFQQVNSEIYNLADKYGIAGHMGTTGIAAVLRGTTMTLCWAGDSRAYIVNRDRRLARQISFDHSQAEEEIRAGMITREQASMMPEKNFLSRSLGGREFVDPETRVGDVRQGDLIVLCSDGMSRYLQEGHIGTVCLDSPSSQHAAETMGMMAYNAGGKDNITVIVVHMGDRQAVATMPLASDVPISSTAETLLEGDFPSTSFPTHVTPSNNINPVYILSGIIGVLVIVLIGLLGLFFSNEEANNQNATATQQVLEAGLTATQSVLDAEASEIAEQITQTQESLVGSPTETMGGMLLDGLPSFPTVVPLNFQEIDATNTAQSVIQQQIDRGIAETQQAAFSQATEAQATLDTQNAVATQISLDITATAQQVQRLTPKGLCMAGQIYYVQVATKLRISAAFLSPGSDITKGEQVRITNGGSIGEERFDSAYGSPPNRFCYAIRIVGSSGGGWIREDELDRLPPRDEPIVIISPTVTATATLPASLPDGGNNDPLGSGG